MTRRNREFWNTFWKETRGLLVALFVALLIRNFLYEPFKIPSSSMVPTLLVGDFLFVNKFTYGIKSPYSEHVLNQSLPERGDIVVFRKQIEADPAWCAASSVVNLVFVGLNDLVGCSGTAFIKRVVGLPGDELAFRDKTLFINGEAVPYELTGDYTYSDGNGGNHTVRIGTENLRGVEHQILIDENRQAFDVAPMVVPEGKFVVMGDNRDNSIDSRFWLYPEWGYVDQSALVGRAEVIFWSWENWVPRFDRLLNSLRVERHAE